MSGGMDRHQALADLAGRVADCRGCGLAEGRTNVVVSSGPESARVAVVGEAPGREEDLAGRPFVGRSGRLLDQLLDDTGGLGRNEVYVVNMVKCRPPDNRAPKADELAACRPFLDEQLALVHPRVVVTLGNVATRAMLDTKEGITSLRGRSHADPGGAPWPIVPTFHPSAGLRNGARVTGPMREDLARAAELAEATR
jgi:DNA polymerase